MFLNKVQSKNIKGMFFLITELLEIIYISIPALISTSEYKEKKWTRLSLTFF